MRVKCPKCKLYVEYDNDDFITDDEGRTGIRCIFCDTLIELEAPQKPEVPIPVRPEKPSTPAEQVAIPAQEQAPKQAAPKPKKQRKPKQQTNTEATTEPQAPEEPSPETPAIKKPRKKTAKTKPQSQPAPSAPQPTSMPPQAQQEGCTNGQGCGCLILVVLIVALGGYFLNWWGLPFLPDRDKKSEVAAEMTEVIPDNFPSESRLINLIQLANKAQSSGITPEFAEIIQQYCYAPNVVWEGGIAKPDFSPELLVEQAELGDVLNVEILDRAYSDDGTRAEVLFEYYSQLNEYKSDTHQAIAYLVYDGESWLVDDLGMDYSQYGGVSYRLTESMKIYSEASNKRILSGETMRDLYTLFSDRPEELRTMISYIQEYADAYDISIPDSLSRYFVDINNSESPVAEGYSFD